MQGCVRIPYVFKLGITLIINQYSIVAYWILTCLIWKHSLYGNPGFWLWSTLNCSLQPNHHIKIFSETSVDLTISMASYFYRNFGHCRSFIILNRKNFSSGAILCKRSREKRQEGERAKSRDILAIEAHQWKSWNTHLFSHWDARNRLDSLTQDTKQCSKFRNSKWHHNFVKHSTTPRYVCMVLFA